MPMRENSSEESPSFSSFVSNIGSETREQGTTPDWTVLQSKIYAREQETAKLIQALDDCCVEDEKRQRQLVLLSGNSGTGKTRLASTLRPLIAGRSGLFLSGKFDQLEGPEVYEVAAFSSISPREKSHRVVRHSWGLCKESPTTYGPWGRLDSLRHYCYQTAE